MIHPFSGIRAVSAGRRAFAPVRSAGRGGVERRAFGLGLAIAVAVAGPGGADERPGSTFKRVKVGETASGAPRINVQIDGAEQARILAANPAVPARPEVPAESRPAGGGTGRGGDAGAPGSLAWYWDLVSPDRASAAPGRLSSVETALRSGPQDVPTPRLATLQRIAEEHGRDILRASVGTGVSPALALAVIAVESAGRPRAVSHAGAAGLMQLMPATAERFGVSDRMDSAANISGGTRYLDWLLGRFDGDVVLALAGYNAGEGAVDSHGGVPPFAETRDYVPKVMAAWTLAKGLCLTPPQLVSDACVFRTGTRLANSP